MIIKSKKLKIRKTKNNRNIRKTKKKGGGWPKIFGIGKRKQKQKPPPPQEIKKLKPLQYTISRNLGYTTNKIQTHIPPPQEIRKQYTIRQKLGYTTSIKPTHVPQHIHNAVSEIIGAKKRHEAKQIEGEKKNLPPHAFEIKNYDKNDILQFTPEETERINAKYVEHIDRFYNPPPKGPPPIFTRVRSQWNTNNDE